MAATSGTGWVVALLLAVLAAPQVAAHTREKLRIDEVEAAMTRQDALLAQKLEDAAAEGARLGEALAERAQHARFLEGRIEALRTDMQTALGGVREALVRGEEAKRVELERRLEAAAEERAAAAARTQALEHQRLGQEAEGVAAGLAQLRTYLSTLTASMEGNLAALKAELAALRQEQARDRESSEKRLAGLLAAVNDENLKLRAAISRLAGAPAAPRTHVVQAGESLYGIARQYGVALEELKKANPELARPGAVINPGQQVTVPGP